MRTLQPLVALVLGVALLTAGCGRGAGSPRGSSAGASGAAGSSAHSSNGASAPIGSALASGESPSGTSPDATQFQNPVIDRNYADPFVLRADDMYYAFATGDLTYNIQVSTSDDLVTWSPRREALRTLPFWQPSAKGLTWAPEVVQTSAGFVMHYTARDVQAGRQCLAVAVAEKPEGPYVDSSDAPLTCQYDLGGSIDSSPFQDADGRRYLLWKSDGNCCAIPVRFFIADLSEDGLTLTSPARELNGLTADRAWEGTLIEAPTLVLNDGRYYLFFSANDYNSRDYAVGYATADAIEGPYTDAAENPILSTQVPFGSPPGDPAGPGHQSIVADDEDDLWLVYHAWDSGRIGDSLGGRRAMWIDELVFEAGKPFVKGPDSDPQPRP
jgi:beta-xylosidase